LKNNFVKIRFKIIIAYLFSAILSGMCMLLLFITGIFAFKERIYDLLRWLNSNVLAIPLLILAALLLFFLIMSVFFIKFTQSNINYLGEIIKGLKIISQGELNINIPVKTKDEFGEMASTINSMTVKLKALMEEERYWERTKNELITNVSHDLRTPLTSILGYVELISGDSRLDEGKQKQYTDIIREKCLRLKKLIDDLFEYSKLSSREMVISKASLNLGELLEQVAMGFIPIISAQGLEYRITSKGEKPMVFGDPALLARLFDNLISNAISYGKEGKYIDIETLQENREAVVRIINYCEDIPEGELSHIFERFYRVEKSRSRQKGGTGLGLAIVKNIIDLHNGTVNVVSRNGKTVFEVRLGTV
jgi:signal transduction histidine kinase